MAARAILFDVDGTLLDTNYFHVLAWWRSFRGQGIEVAMAYLQERIGMGSDKMLAEVAGPDRDGLHQRLNHAHSENFALFRPEMRAFPQAAELLRDVSRSGAQVWLATSAKSEEMKHIREVIGADDAIAGEVSSGEVDSSKPDPDIFLRVLEKAGVSADAAMVVGDAPWDVKGARAAGLDCVCLRTGGFAQSVLLEAGAVAVYNDAAELRRSLRESPLARLLSPAEAAGAGG